MTKAKFEIVDGTRYDITWKEFEYDCQSLIKQLRFKKYDYVVGIGRGGLVASVMVSHALRAPLFPIAWDGTDQSKEIARIFIEGLSGFSNILIVDDIIDNASKSIEEVSDLLKIYLQTYKNPSIIDIAAVYQKNDVIGGAEFVGDQVDGDNWYVFPWED